jgi:hypothetical protein
MFDDGSQSLQAQSGAGPFNVPVGQSYSGTIFTEATDGYHNGPAYFTFSMTNNQQTG